MLRRYEMPWRRAYELHAAIAWAAGVVWLLAVGLPGWLHPHLAWPLAVGCLLLAGRRLNQAFRVLTLRASLVGHAMQTLTTRELARWCQTPEQVFLGFGFEWLPHHSQRLYELSKIDYRPLLVPSPLLRWLGDPRPPQPDDEIGLPYLHGVEPQEHALYRPLQNFEGGTLLIGTTQSGKGVALATLITQAVRRGDVVIVLDPKNSQRLKRVVEQACRDYRESDTFLEFHPAFPERGVRLDFTFNWQKPTEIASRIQSVLPPDTSGAFAAFAWDAVNVVVQALVDIEERPNLVKLTQSIEGGIEPVLERSLSRFYEQQWGPAWREHDLLKKLMEDARRGKLKRPSEAASPELLALVSYYEHHLPPSRRIKVLDAQVRTFRHNREHYQKITANLLPILSMLTSGDLGRSLSPDPFDPHDPRPIMNFEKIERAGHVLYMCLDALPDPAVASAIGALALADLAARVGMRYNLGGGRRIALFVDEVANVINAPLIELLNKGAEGGVYTTCAMQTLADLAERLGSEHAARKALGNLNNLIALRSKDRPTQDFIVETFGKTAIHTLRHGLSTGIDAHIGDFSSSHSTTLTEGFEERVPADMLGKLPNLQYFASVSGGRLLKGRFPIIEPAPEATP